MKKLLQIILLLSTIISFSQKDGLWSPFNSETSKLVLDKSINRDSFPKEFLLFSLNLSAMQRLLISDLKKTSKQSIVISLPNVDGKLEQFELVEASNFDSELQARFPQIRAFSGKGITDKSANLKISIAPNGIQTMVFRTEKPNEFIESYSADGTIYAVYNSQRQATRVGWRCSTAEEKQVQDINKQVSVARTNDGNLRTMRLAQSCTAEYSNYFGATDASQVDLVLTAYNNTLTRCNGVYEKDLAIHLFLTANSVNVIYYDAATDPYSAASSGAAGAWNGELQTTLNTVLGDATFDIGHLFGATGGGGSAGCIGCVCSDDPNNYKGSGYTSPAGSNPVPKGDSFDIDYVVHEIGHQLGGTHSFTTGLESANTNIEVGSGVTIMGYAGITSYDAARNSIDIYHARSIQQIQSNLATKSCFGVFSLSGTNATPVSLAGLDYTIPISTPFILTGDATDADPNNVLTYCWEQYDVATSSAASGANSVANATKLTGPNWISLPATTSKTRMFPRLSSVMANQIFTNGTGNEIIKVESLSSVARNLNFRLTIRDNAPYSSVLPYSVGQTGFDNMRVVVSAASGPFVVTSQNTTLISYPQNSSQTVTWNVASTTAAPVNCANVKISLSDNNGTTFPYVLLASTPNNGSADVIIPPGILSSNCRIKVESVGNIFFNVNTQKFTVTQSLSNTDFSLQNFDLYPNPNNGNFTVKFDSNSSNEIKIQVVDLQGRDVFSKSYSNNGIFNENIQLNNLQSGVYLFKIEDGDKKVVKKIVIE